MCICYNNSMKPVTESLPAPLRLRGRPSDPRVTMSNALTRAAHRLDLPEKRVVALAISKMDSRAPARTLDSNGRQVSAELVSRLHARDYADAFGVTESDGYKLLKSAALNLMRRLITFYIPAHKRDGKLIRETFRTVQWTSACEYTKGSGEIRIEWHKDVVPHLLGLQKHFTVYRLAQMKHLRP